MCKGFAGHLPAPEGARSVPVCVVSKLDVWLRRMLVGLEELREVWRKHGMFSEAEVATILGVPATEVSALVESGRLHTTDEGIHLDAISDFLYAAGPDEPWRVRKHAKLPKPLRNKLDPLIGTSVGARILGYSSGRRLIDFASRLDVPLEPHPRSPQYRSIRSSHLLMLWTRRATGILKSRRESRSLPSLTSLDLRKSIMHPELVSRWTTEWARGIPLPTRWPHECTPKPSR